MVLRADIPKLEPVPVLAESLRVQIHEGGGSILPTELSHITSVVTHYSLAYPEIAFQLRTLSGEPVNAPAVDSLRERVFQLFGEQLLEQLVQFGPLSAESFSPSPNSGEAQTKKLENKEPPSEMQSMAVPAGNPASWTLSRRPPAISRRVPEGSCWLRVSSVSRETAPSEGNASPRKPMVEMESRSSALRSLLVA